MAELGVYYVSVEAYDQVTTYEQKPAKRVYQVRAKDANDAKEQGKQRATNEGLKWPDVVEILDNWGDVV